MHPKLGKIWLATSLILFVLATGLAPLLRTTLVNNGDVPWNLQLSAAGWILWVLGAILGGLAFSYIFLQGYRGRGLWEGVRYGLWVTLLVSVVDNLKLAAILPTGRRLPIEFGAVGLLSFVVCGIAAAAIAGRTGAAAASGAAC
ncbi:MAG: hypothetical protein ACRD01_02350 [Terriglobales bacterium]